MGLFFSTNLYSVDTSEVISIKKDILKAYSKDSNNKTIFQYLDMTYKMSTPVTLHSLLGNDLVGVNINQSLNSNPMKKVKLYFFDAYIRKYLQFDYEMYNSFIDGRNETADIVRNKSEKILNVATGLIAIHGTVKSGIKDIKKLNYIKAGVQRGGSSQLYFNQMAYLVDIKATEVLENVISGLFTDGPMGRIMGQCVFVSDMSALAGCGLETGGQLVLNIGDLSRGFSNIRDGRRRGAALVATSYLKIYYLLGEDKNKLNDFLNNQMALEKSEYDNLEEQLDAIAKFEWNKKYEVGGSIQYHYDTAKEYIEKYQKMIDSMSKDFMDSFSALIVNDIEYDDITRFDFITGSKTNQQIHRYLKQLYDYKAISDGSSFGDKEYSDKITLSIILHRAIFYKTGKKVNMGTIKNDIGNLTKTEIATAIKKYFNLSNEQLWKVLPKSYFQSSSKKINNFEFAMWLAKTLNIKTCGRTNCNYKDIIRGVR
jgi:hypothetical protein